MQTSLLLLMLLNRSKKKIKYFYINFNIILNTNIKELTGCAWHTLAISSQDAPYSIAKTASLTISPTPYKMLYINT